MSLEEEHYRDLVRALELAWDLECGISWYDVTDSKNELNELRRKYQVEPWDDEVRSSVTTRKNHTLRGTQNE